VRQDATGGVDSPLFRRNAAGNVLSPAAGSHLMCIAMWAQRCLQSHHGERNSGALAVARREIRQCTVSYGVVPQIQGRGDDRQAPRHEIGAVTAR
jgi:hypothetical protein